MFKFNRAKILPVYLSRRMTIDRLARTAGVSNRTVDRAVNGLPITGKVVEAIAAALSIDAMEFLETSQKEEQPC